MSDFKVEVVLIDEILPHPNADRLELARVKGWHCVVGKGHYKAGDKAIYFPIDSILPNDVEEKIFPAESKVKLSNHRVRTIKLRGAISQGLVVDLKTLNVSDEFDVGEDLTSLLKVTKYEPVDTSVPRDMRPTAKRHRNPFFKEYTDLSNIKNYPDLFKEGELVVITEKIHGTNFRCGKVPFVADTLWRKFKSWFRLNPEYEFVHGSRRVQLQNVSYNGFYSDNLYSKIVTQYGLEESIQYNSCIYGEVYGSGVQKHYEYGKDHGEHGLVVFDIMMSGKYLDYYEYIAYCAMFGLPKVPVLYVGPFHKDKIKEFISGPSVLYPGQLVREGIVIKPIKEDDSYIGRKILKCINEEYLLKDNTDFH